MYGLNNKVVIISGWSKREFTVTVINSGIIVVCTFICFLNYDKYQVEV